jgi:hypothetical protein
LGTVSSMAEVGLLHFVRVALEVAQAVLPDYPAPQVLQAHLHPAAAVLAVVCLVR